MLSGFPTVFGIDVTKESSTPKHQLGTIGMTADGRIYRYAKMGEAIDQAHLCIEADLSANHEDIVFQTAGVAGDTTVSLTVATTSITANEYVGGYLVIIDDTGEGYTHLITRHDAGTGTITVDIKPGLQAATTTSTTVTLVRSPFYGVLEADGGTQTDVPVGVTPMSFTNAYYGWIQTRGIGAILTSGTNAPTAGEPITIGEANDGSVSGRDATAEPFVGIALTGVNPTAGEHNPYFIMLE